MSNPYTFGFTSSIKGISFPANLVFMGFYGFGATPGPSYPTLTMLSPVQVALLKGPDPVQGIGAPPPRLILPYSPGSDVVSANMGGGVFVENCLVFRAPSRKFAASLLFNPSLRNNVPAIMGVMSMLTQDVEMQDDGDTTGTMVVQSGLGASTVTFNAGSGGVSVSGPAFSWWQPFNIAGLPGIWNFAFDLNEKTITQTIVPVG